MPANKYALLRYRIIDRCLTKKNFPNKEDLRQACEDSLYGSYGENISESTIEKDLWAMRNESELGYHAPIKYSKLEKGYFYEDENYSISELSLNEADIESIQIAAATLNQFKDNPIFQQYENAIDKIVNRLTITANPSEENLESLIQFENTPKATGTEYLNPLLSAIKNQEIIQIYYQKYSSNQAQKYILEPYLLKEYRNRWYLISFEKSREKFLTFGLERIEKLDLTDEFYTRNIDFNSDRFFKDSIGITEIDTEPKSITLEFDALQANYIMSKPLHHSQKIIEQNESTTTIELQVLETYELIQLILGFGKSVRVKSPKELAHRIKKELESSLSHYE